MKVIIFGAGNNYKMRKENYEKEYDVVAVVDNDAAKIHTGIAQSVDVIQTLEYDAIIITPSIYEDIYKQLVEIGVSSARIIVDALKPNLYRKDILNNHYWGQHADDLVIEAIFSRIGIAKPSYMDLGANHPIDNSNTISLYLSGCRGINIEANPVMMRLIEVVKPDDININLGVASVEGVMDFYEYDETSGLNTFSLDEAKSWDKEPAKVTKLQVVRLERIVNDYCPDGFPDFLDCDIEGLDYDVLLDYDLEKNGPKVICVEVRERQVGMFDEMLGDKGYYRFCRIGENNIYVQKKYSDVVSHMSFE